MAASESEICFGYRMSTPSPTQWKLRQRKQTKKRNEIMRDKNNATNTHECDWSVSSHYYSWQTQFDVFVNTSTSRRAVKLPHYLSSQMRWLCVFLRQSNWFLAFISVRLPLALRCWIISKSARNILCFMQT